MFPTVDDASALKATADGTGLVWTLRGDQMPRCSGEHVNQFVESAAVKSAVLVRVPGSLGNALLLTRLYNQRIRGHLGRLEVCSPACYEEPNCAPEPALLLYRMRRVTWPPSLGGWHEFTCLDLPSYLLSHMILPDGKVPELATKILEGHPAWPSWSFINPLGKSALAEVVARVLDPRWHLNRDDPDSLAPLDAYLGLPVDGNGDEPFTTGWRGERYQTLKRCWCPGGKVKGKIRDSRAYFHRVKRSTCGLAGELTACFSFVAFLRDTWLQAVTPGPKGRRLFAPELFFHNGECKDYLNWMASFRTPDGAGT